MTRARPSVSEKPLAGDDSPLASAVRVRDADILAMVSASLRRGDAMLAYQPIVSAQQPNKIAFHEGLIRVLDDTGRVIPAAEFIDSCEQHEAGRLLDCAALEHGLAALRRDPALRLAINMSARSIGYPRWLATLERGLAADPTVGERLILEITERSAIVLPELTGAFMSDLQMRGISFALDDFGAGFTSCRYLRDFDFDIVKIAGEFVNGIATNRDNQVLTQALVSLARHFDMFTVAESIESAEDAAVAARLGCDCLQGYYFGVPSIRPPQQVLQPTEARQA